VPETLPRSVPSVKKLAFVLALTVLATGFRSGGEPTTGAYFYKVSSEPRADAIGIEGTGVLPRPVFDASRFHTPSDTESEYFRGPLDVPDVYMGGHSSSELDCGLSWSRVLDDKKRPLWTDDPSGSDGRDPAHQFVLERKNGDLVASVGSAVYSVRGSLPNVELVAADGTVKEVSLQPDFAFRPYWRHVTRATGNTWANPEPGDPGYIWLYPGERFDMSVAAVARDKVRLKISLATDPSVALDETFEAVGFGTGRATTWKRVNSIDQFRELENGDRKGNEDHPIIATATRVEGGRWDSCSLLLRGSKKEPVVGDRFVLMRDTELGNRFGSVFRTSATTADGGESIDITPTPSKTPGITGALGSH
jgi:hypothetical protein